MTASRAGPNGSEQRRHHEQGAKKEHTGRLRGPAGRRVSGGVAQAGQDPGGGDGSGDRGCGCGGRESMRGGGAMTHAERKQAREGQDYWWQYVRLNGYAFEPKNAGLKRLSRNLDVSVTHLRKCIHAYLSA